MLNFWKHFIRGIFFWFTFSYSVTFGRYLERNKIERGSIISEHQWLDYVHVTVYKTIKSVIYLVEDLVYIMTYAPENIYLLLGAGGIAAYIFIWCVYLIILIGLIIWFKSLILFLYEHSKSGRANARDEFYRGRNKKKGSPS